jgi:hypothetical protein
MREMLTAGNLRFNRWLAALEARHLRDLTFSEVARALRALSSIYVERRRQLACGGALTGRGKRAAFALFYGPIHHLIVRSVVEGLSKAAEPRATILDLGCGTGAAGAAWAAACAGPPAVLGVDRHPWALSEASRTYDEFGLAARVRRVDLSEFSLPPQPLSLLAAFTLNELTDSARDALLAQALNRARRRDRGERPHERNQLLVVEPVAGFVAPWWDRWKEAVVSAGGRSDEWRFRVDLPPLVAKLDRAAGLDHRVLTARSLWL